MEEIPQYIIDEAKRLGYIQLISQPNIFSFMNGESYLAYNGNELVCVVKQ